MLINDKLNERSENDALQTTTLEIYTRAHRRGGEYAVRRSSQHSDGDGSLTEVVDDVIFCPKLFEDM